MVGIDEGSGNNWIWFGDGNTCPYFQMFNKIDEEEGTEIITILMRPSQPMVEQYDLTDDIDPATGLMITKFQKTYVEHLVSIPGKNRILITVNPKGDPTQLSRRDEHLSAKIQQQQRMIRNQEIEIASLTQKHRKLSERATEYIKDSNKLINEARKAGGKIKTDEDDEE